MELPERHRQSNANYITPGWFSTFGTTILSGRDISAKDRKGSPSVVIINQAFVQKFLKGAPRAA